MLSPPSKLRHAAEDVTQQTFLSLLEHVDSFRGESSAVTWAELPDENTDSTLPHPEFIARWSATPETLVQRAEVREQIETAL
jgi:hypothetical protein